MTLKIITWNCNMAFRKKADQILSYKPDIVIVPECEHFDKFIFTEAALQPKDSLWFGQNRNKGLGVFSYSNYRFKILNDHNPTFKMIVPIAVTGGHFDFNLFAVWANNPADHDGHYITQVWKAVKYYDNIIQPRQTILIGDFNSNTIWDKPRREGNHSAVVKWLEAKGIHSVYHKHFKQTQGNEQHPTLYMYRHKDKSYHIDYCFASSDILQYLKSVEIGDYESWVKLSDHVPVVVTFGRAINKKKKKVSI